MGVVLLTLVVYLPGLNGSFLFDDTPNIVRPMRAWLDGQTSWQELVLGNHSGLLGRRLSMLSFVANGATTGLAVWPFKLTNLFVHLVCGGLIYLLLAQLLRRDPLLSTRARLTAGLIAAVWLLHPMQVSTVLYVVQRMAQLATLFMLLALWAFVLGREALQAGRLRQGLWYLFILVPGSTLLAMASKENGALVPLLCAGIELAYFRPQARQYGFTVRSKWALRIFLAGFIALPLVAASVFLLFRPDFFLAGYDGRLFTFGERLLSQPRALLDYAGLLLLPRGAALGLYTDDFPVSHGLLDPPSTLWAILGLTAWLIASVILKKRIPALFAGTWIFFAGHAMESSIFPLEIYFEHRNYFPSMGIFLGVAGLLGWLLPRLRQRLPLRSRNRLFIFASLSVLLLLASATAVRSTVWRTWVGIAEQGVRQHPLSRRAHLDKLSVLLALDRPEEARTILLKMLDFPDQNARHQAALELVSLDCREYGKVSQNEVARLTALHGQKLQLADLFGGERLGNQLIQEDCDGLTKTQFADILRNMTATAQQQESSTPVWRLRFMASRLYAESGLLPHAIEQSALAWMTGAADPAVGVYLVNLYYAAGDRKSAEILVPQVQAQIADWDHRNQRQLAKVLDHYHDDPEAGTTTQPDQAPGEGQAPAD